MSPNVNNISYSSITITLICFGILLFLMITAVIGVIIYINKNNKLIEQHIKDQNNRDFSRFKDAIESMNIGVVDSVIEALKDYNTIQQHPQQEQNFVDKEKNREELLNTFARLRGIIKEDLYNTMKATSACRTAVYLFHNGTKSTHGLHLLKVSCIGEKTLVGSGVQEQILNHSNMPVNMFDNMVEKLTDNGRYTIINDEVTMNTARAKFISAHKIKYSIASAIYDNSNSLLGFILAEFDHNYTKNTSDVEYECLKKLSDKISPILSFSEYADLTLQNMDTEDEAHHD